MVCTLHSIKIHFSSHPGFWLFVAFLWALISIARTPPLCFPDRSSSSSPSVRYVPIHSNTTTATAAATLPEPPPALYTDDCPSGRVFSYDLPPPSIATSSSPIAPISTSGIGNAASSPTTATAAPPPSSAAPSPTISTNPGTTPIHSPWSSSSTTASPSPFVEKLAATRRSPAPSK
ncbi:flocculation protein FLO11-like [Salvia hispanica]|uniref:flocculation protein FLO11-like n=1 Tax=Salvia hispanica TaxID=49212 RepID=UPI0020094DCB|nr:flocculation protein FLO11-like [Salvia hispanica]